MSKTVEEAFVKFLGANLALFFNMIGENNMRIYLKKKNKRNFNNEFNNNFKYCIGT